VSRIKFTPRVLGYKVESCHESLTPRAGLALVGELMGGIGLPEAIDRALPGPGSGRGYRPSAYVVPALAMLHGGGACLDDLREVRDDEALRRLMGLVRVPAPTAYGDWLRRMGGDWEGAEYGDSEGLRGLAEVRRHINRRLLKGRKEIGVDVDASAIESHKQEARYTYKGFPGYMPMLATIAGTEAILWDEFREGNVSPGARPIEVLEGCEQEARALGVRISDLRSDSAYYIGEVFNWCEERGVRFTISADLNKAVRELIEQIPGEQWTPLPDSDRRVAETVHCMGTTQKSFRLIVQRWKNPKADLFESHCYFVIATNREDPALAVIDWYNQRGNCEDGIGELKHGYGMDRLPCGTAAANAVWFRLGTIAYCLGGLLKRCLPDDLKTRRVKTLRWRLYEIAAKLVRTGRRWVLRLAASATKIELFRDVRRKCYALRYG